MSLFFPPYISVSPPRHLTLSLMVISSTQLGQSSPAELPVNSVSILQSERLPPPPSEKGPLCHVGDIQGRRKPGKHWPLLKHSVTATLSPGIRFSLFFSPRISQRSRLLMSHVRRKQRHLQVSCVRWGSIVKERRLTKEKKKQKEEPVPAA